MHDTTTPHNLSATARRLLATVELGLSTPPNHYAAPTIPPAMTAAELGTLIDAIHRTPHRTVHVTTYAHGQRVLFVSDERLARRRAPAIAFMTAIMSGKGMREATRIYKAAERAAAN